MGKKIISLYLTACVVAAMLAVSCNNSTSDTTTYTTVSTTSTLVYSFKLGANKNVLNNLDSVHFTIDQDRLVIYNADSLPVGTDVTHMVANINFASTVSRAQFHVTGGKVMSDTSFYYSSATTDSIDFTGNVRLTVYSYNNEISRDYTIKVNVHQMVPDTLNWSQSSRRNLPNSSGTITAQRMVRQGADGKYYSMLTQNGTTSISTATSLSDDNWSVTAASLPFAPIVESFSANDDALFVLDQSHELMTSTDGGASWSDTGVAWYSIQGGYGSRVLGLLQDGSTYKHDEYPRRDGFTPAAVETNFPISSSSPLVTASNTWLENQQAMLVGGVDETGNVINDVWGYDGNIWGKISVDNPSWVLPALKGAVLIPYYTHDVNTATWEATKYVTWLVMGGTDKNGELNRTVYSSRDQGIRWSAASSSLQLPSFIPAFTGAQAFIQNVKVKSTRKNIRLRVSERVTEWDCPYIYLVGGTSQKGMVYNNIWCGVINRLMFEEVY